MSQDISKGEGRWSSQVAIGRAFLDCYHDQFHQPGLNDAALAPAACFVELPSCDRLVAVSGRGYCQMGWCFSSAALVRAVAGTIAEMLAPQSSENELLVTPADAVPIVRLGRAEAQALGPRQDDEQVLRTVAAELSLLYDRYAARLAIVDDLRPQIFWGNTNIEACIVHCCPDRIAYVQIGAFAPYRLRDNQLDQIGAIGTLADAFRRETGVSPGDDFPHPQVLTHSMGFVIGEAHSFKALWSDGGEVLSGGCDLRAGDRVGLISSTASIDRQEIVRCLRLDGPFPLVSAALEADPTVSALAAATTAG